MGIFVFRSPDTVPFKSKGHITHKTEDPRHCSSSTLIGGKGGAGPSSFHTMLEGATEESECMIHVESS